MRLQIRYYKRFDTDLLALFEAGYPLNKYFKNALYAYAHGEEYHLYVRDCKPHDLNGPQFIHTVINVTDKESIELMRNIKHGYRNAFCKMLLREALVYQYLGAYFADDETAAKYITKERRRIAGYSTSTPGTIVAEASHSRKRMYDEIRRKYIGENENSSSTEKKSGKTMTPKIDNRKTIKGETDESFTKNITKLPERKKETVKQPKTEAMKEIPFEQGYDVPVPAEDDIFGQKNIVQTSDKKEPLFDYENTANKTEENSTAADQLYDVFAKLEKMGR